MKRHLAQISTVLLALLLLVGCIQAPASAPQRYPGQPTSSAGPASEGEPLRVAIPVAYKALGEALALMAEQEGISLHIETLPATGEAYAQQLSALLQSPQQAPALFWAESAAQMAALPANAAQNLAAGEAPKTVRALAAMSKGRLGLFVESSCLGLPLGYYGSGTLVNLNTLAQLLGTQDKAGLLRDLQQCSWLQWAELLLTVQNYLEKPARTQVMLGEHSYTMPRFRPASARALRGMFAGATHDGADWLHSQLGAALASAFDDANAFSQADATRRAEALAEPMDALFVALELETRLLTIDGKAAGRGENYADLPAVDTAQAEKQFATGAALLLPADSRAAQAMQSSYPGLADQLALIATKLPLEQSHQRVGSQIGISTDGYLCVNAKTAQISQAYALLVRLLASKRGWQSITNTLGLVPFSQQLPPQPLAAQVQEAVATGSYYAQPATQTQITRAAQRIGEWMQDYLMAKPMWDTEDQQLFRAVALQSFSVV